MCHERSTKVERCYGKDEGRPLGAAFQEEASNRPRLRRLRGGVVNAGGKGGAQTTSGRCQGEERKRSAVDGSKEPDVVDTRGAANLWAKPAGDLSTAPAATGLEAAGP